MAYGTLKIDNIETSTKTLALNNLVDGSVGSVTSGMIADGTIVNADINASAGIADTKLATISTADKVSLSALNIDGGTDIGAALADADLFVVDDGGAGTNRKAAATRITDYAFGKVSGDVTIASNGTAAISSGVIVNADVSASAAIAGSKISPDFGGQNVTTTGSVSDGHGSLRRLPQNSQTSAYTLVASDTGKHISITTGGVTVPPGIFSAGDVVTVFNNSASNQTITQGGSVTLRQSGTANTGNRTLAQYGVATVLCVTSNTFVISGSGLS